MEGIVGRGAFRNYYKRYMEETKGEGEGRGGWWGWGGVEVWGDNAYHCN